MTNDERREHNGGWGTAFTGMVIGLIAGAAAVIFSDKRKREELQDKLDEWREGGQEQAERARQKLGEVKNQAGEKAGQVAEEAETAISEARRRAKKIN